MKRGKVENGDILCCLLAEQYAQTYVIDIMRTTPRYALTLSVCTCQKQKMCHWSAKKNSETRDHCTAKDLLFWIGISSVSSPTNATFLTSFLSSKQEHNARMTDC